MVKCAACLEIKKIARFRLSQNKLAHGLASQPSYLAAAISQIAKTTIAADALSY
jgi:hypothetical protein